GNTQGVKVMRMKDDKAKVVAFTVVPHQDEEPEEAAQNTDGAVESQAEPTAEQSAENNSEE
ncbi:MAG: hypothetical protein K2K24_04200, partial [Clostridia bacterium]|nr:hypothetical protein [Clostridia bacterium]